MKGMEERKAGVCELGLSMEMDPPDDRDPQELDNGLGIGPPLPTPIHDLNDLSKEELVERVRKLQLHVKQLRNVVNKARTLALHDGGPLCKRNRNERPFDFSMYVWPGPLPLLY